MPLFSCKDNNSVSNEEPTNQKLPASELYYSFDYGTHTATVIKTPDVDTGSIGNLSYYQPSTYSGDIVIPSTVIYYEEEYTVTGIGERAFTGAKDLHSLHIPSTIDTIAKEAILDTPNLDYITVDSKNPKFDSRYKCNAIIETKTNTLIVGSNYTFIPSNVYKIGPWTLNGLSFETLEIQEGLKKIDHHSLQNLRNLKTITFPSSLEIIEEDALARCPSLKTVTIGKNVNKIVDAFLAGDKSLETITCLAITPPQWVLANVDIPQNVILYVPDNSVSSYINDEVWGKYFKDNIRPISTK